MLRKICQKYGTNIIDDKPICSHYRSKVLFAAHSIDMYIGIYKDKPRFVTSLCISMYYNRKFVNTNIIYWIKHFTLFNEFHDIFFQ